MTAPVLLVSARDGTGIDALVAALDDHRRHLEGGGLRERRELGRQSHVCDTLERRYGSHGLDQLGGRAAVLARVREEASASAFELVRSLGREIEEALSKLAPG